MKFTVNSSRTVTQGATLLIYARDQQSLDNLFKEAAPDFNGDTSALELPFTRRRQEITIYLTRTCEATRECVCYAESSDEIDMDAHDWKEDAFWYDPTEDAYEWQYEIQDVEARELAPKEKTSQRNRRIALNEAQWEFGDLNRDYYPEVLDYEEEEEEDPDESDEGYEQDEEAEEEE